MMFSCSIQQSLRHCRKRTQQGVTMIVAMVMLVVIGLMSVSVMRSSLNADLIANNVRDQILAEQAANIALRYCEKRSTVAANVLTPTDNDANPLTPSPPYWSTFANWKNGDAAYKATKVPLDILKSGDSSFWPSKYPECLAENSVMNNGKGTAIVIVTARGFSTDYTEDSAGRTKTGSVVWLQSVLRVQ
jgi:type IV pilus assembly protein PilX